MPPSVHRPLRVIPKTPQPSWLDRRPPIDHRPCVPTMLSSHMPDNEFPKEFAYCMEASPIVGVFPTPARLAVASQQSTIAWQGLPLTQSSSSASANQVACYSAANGQAISTVLSAEGQRGGR